MSDVVLPKNWTALLNVETPDTVNPDASTLPLILPVTLPVRFPEKVVAVTTPVALILPVESIPTPVELSGFLPTWNW